MPEKRHCASCGQHTLHNPMKGKENEDGKFRCTYCGHPVSTSAYKREAQEAIRRKQVAKLGRLV